jgi:hypothetical protein
MIWPTLEELGMGARLTRDLPRFLRNPLTPNQCAAILRRRLETRAERFLAVVERAIYRNRRSPYLRLLRAAGCESGDLRDLVAREGVEGALQELADRGVYVSLEEFKGQREILRGSERFAVVEEDFDFPRQPAHFEQRTGGTRSPGTIIRTSLAFAADQAVNQSVTLQAHGFVDTEHVVWMTAPLKQMFRYAKLGRQRLAWFYPIAPLPWKVWLIGHYLHWYGRWLGSPLPRPMSNDLRDSDQMAHRLAGWLREGRRLCLTCYASSGVRVAQAAARLGLSLEGTCFFTIGEPFTAAKLAALEAVGARANPTYSSTEAGLFATRCGTTRAPDDLHVFRDSFALIRRPRPIGDFGLSVEALHVTVLVPSAPKVMLNVELGDYAELEQRDCGCLLGELGLSEHIWDIASHEKLTSEGMTFARTRLVPVLEQVLPSRYGGTSADYQVVEEEGPDGILHLSLLMHPRLGPVDERQLAETFLAELGGDGLLEGYMAKVWERAGTVRVRREPPRATRAGKILPFHLSRGQGGS